MTLAELLRAANHDEWWNDDKQVYCEVDGKLYPLTGICGGRPEKKGQGKDIVVLTTEKTKSAEFAERDENWNFLVELKAFPGEAPETAGVVSVDLSEEDDRGDVEPARDARTGELFCTLGKVDRDGDEVRVVARVWQDREDDSFNGKFHMFRPVALADFVRRLLDANREFDGFTDDDINSLKEVYGV